jgi:pyrroloquinoline quinone (PQQ) biosynthesis protein C
LLPLPENLAHNKYILKGVRQKKKINKTTYFLPNIKEANSLNWFNCRTEKEGCKLKRGNKLVERTPSTSKTKTKVQRNDVSEASFENA